MKPSRVRAFGISTAMLLGSLVATTTATAQTQTQTAQTPQYARSPQAALRHQFANPLLNDVVQMTRAKLSDATIIAYVRARRARLQADISANDLIRLRRAGVSDTVINFVASVVDVSDGSAPPPPPPARENWRDRDVPPANDEPGDVDDGSSGSDDGGLSVYDNPGDAGYPYWYAYSPYWDYGPYWGGGYWGGVAVIGGGRGFHGGFRGGRFHSGHVGGGHSGGGHSGGGHSGGGHSGGGHSGGGHSGGGHH